MVNEMTLLIAIPFVIGIINIFLPTILRKVLIFAGLIYLLFLNFQLFQAVPEKVDLYGYLFFSMDKLALFIITFIQILSFVIFIYSLNGVEKSVENKYMILYPLTVAFCNGAVFSVNSIALLVFWGMSGICLYLFGIFGKTENSPKTAKKTFLIVGGSDVLLILGLVILRYLKSSNGWALWDIGMPLEGQLAYLSFFCLLIAAFAKAGGFPFHTWIPDFCKDSSVESAAFLPASLDKLLGIYLLTRIIMSVFVLSNALHLLVISLGAITVITAVMMAMIQHNGRKLLGYHAISQVGYMIMGIGCGSMLATNGQVFLGSTIALFGGLFHMVNNTIYKSTLFLSLGSVEKRTGTNELDDLGGLGKLMPITFITATIGALSISGIPPFNGFFSKWMIYQGIIDIMKVLSEGYQIWMLICLILAIFGSALTLASFLKFLHTIFLGKRLKSYDHIKEAPINQWIATGLLASMCVIFGLFARQLPLKHLIYPIVTEPSLVGSYQPIPVILLIGFSFLIGFIIYLLTKKVRYDEIYLGGMNALEKYRISGTEFYNEIKEMTLFNSIYKGAEKKYFDVYEWCKGISKFFGKFFSLLHFGQLQFYSIWIIIGIAVLLWIVR